MAEEGGISFSVRLQRARATAGLTQEELAAAARISTREVSDLERGITKRPRQQTVRLLSGALELRGDDLAQFEAAARRSFREPEPRPGVDEYGQVPSSSDADADPRAWFRRAVAALDDLGVASARSVLADWKGRGTADTAWLEWTKQLFELSAAGKLPVVQSRPLPAAGDGLFLGREQQAADISHFLDRAEQGRGGVALVHGPGGIGKSSLLARVLATRPGGVQIEWVTLDKTENGYRGWRRLLAPLWTTVRRDELAPVSLLAHASILDDILLDASDADTAGKPFPGEVAVAIAALLDHIAHRRPLVLVIDDAHRAGASSDQLLVDVAHQISTRVGIVAALRPDELEIDSPISHYVDEADGRAALDMFTPVRVPPLDPDATAVLLRERTKADPPAGIVDQVLRQTGGCPQLINNIQVQFPAIGTAVGAWTVGKLEANGLRVLEPTILSRPAATREVLYAAALCVVGGAIETNIIADVAALPRETVADVLDEERKRGTILALQSPGYRFQHDSWIEALIACCPPADLQLLHARCVDQLRTDPASDPRRLAWHATRAGTLHFSRPEVVAFSRTAADFALADYAFGAAAELYEEAARHAVAEDRIDLLVGEADALRFGGGWEKARSVLRQAARLAWSLDLPGHEAMALIHLERQTWTYGLDESDLTQRIRDVIERLPADQALLRAQAQAALALRLSIAPRQYENEQIDLARAALRQLSSIPSSLARADILLGIRSGLQDDASPAENLGYAQQVLELGLKYRSAYHIGEALVTRIIDIIRGGRVRELPAAFRAHRDFARQSSAQVTLYGHSIVSAMMALSQGQWEKTGLCISRAEVFCKAWGESMASETLLAQTGWLLYETGRTSGLIEMLVGDSEQNTSNVNESLWYLGTALVHAEGDPGAASRMLREVAVGSGDFANLPKGPARIGVLSVAAMLLGHPALHGKLQSGEADRWSASLVGLLTGHPDAMVMVGWPAIILGSKNRFIGLAYLGADQPEQAAIHLNRAVEQNSSFRVLRLRAQFDLARALLRQPGSRPSGVDMMAHVKQEAAELEMARLVTQASIDT
jgi:transcriptional regulator with XRE-family HTH domain